MTGTTERWDVAIIGTGPAGISAAITASIRNKKCLLLGHSSLSEKITKAHRIQNYPGLPEISGQELAAAYSDHLKQLGIAITDRRVSNIIPMGTHFSLLAGDSLFEATSLILATGVHSEREIPGEKEFLGRGVSYCATCDGNFYRGKTVAVISQSAAEEGEAVFLSTLAKKVYYIPLYRNPCSFPENVEVLEDAPKSVSGERTVSKLELRNSTLDVDGVFILRNSIAPAELVPGIELEEGHVQVDRMMATSIPGCFAAGDVIGRPYQYSKAAGEGTIAAISAAHFIDSQVQTGKVAE